MKKSNKDLKIELSSSSNSTFIDYPTFSPSQTPVNTNVTDAIVTDKEVSSYNLFLSVCFNKSTQLPAGNQEYNNQATSNPITQRQPSSKSTPITKVYRINKNLTSLRNLSECYHLITQSITS